MPSGTLGETPSQKHGNGTEKSKKNLPELAVIAASCSRLTSSSNRNKFEVTPMNDPGPNAMTIAQFCAWAGIARSTVYKEIANGRLKARKIGGKTIIAREDANAWFQALPALQSRVS